MAPSTYLTPGVYIEETSGGARPIQAVGTSTAGFVGEAPDADAHLNEVVAIDNWSQFQERFAKQFAANADSPPTPALAQAVYGFFLNGGARCYVVNVGVDGPLVSEGGVRKGVDLFEEVDEIAIVAAPGRTGAADHDALATHCEKMRDRVAILDSVAELTDTQRLKTVESVSAGTKKAKDGDGLLPRKSDGGFTAFYVPWLTVRDPFHPREIVNVPPSGHIAGIYARNDSTRGVHKAPANETVRGALDVSYRITAQEQGELNPLGVNCIRVFSREGVRVWGARTMAGSGSEWQYLNVRRLFNMIEESIAMSTRWVVFEPNDMTLWKAIRRDISSFLMTLWRAGALMGATPEEAFFVKCDSETNPEENLDRGIVTTVIGLAPVKPAEFVIFRIGQHSAGTEVD